ncbi:MULTISPECIES: hypothetical protein [Bradyrhizobium]|uniref:hypothetical protein n=1 Tax=Bradyrhizobium TaxID=374 RepID=UPI001FD89860|nr:MULTISPECIES: hypothetical protein [Bradyrhizobium]
MAGRDARPVDAADGADTAVTNLEGLSRIENFDRKAAIPIAPPAAISNFGRFHGPVPSR